MMNDMMNDMMNTLIKNTSTIQLSISNKPKNINDLLSDELICIFQFLSFKQQVALIPKVCKKWNCVVNTIPFVKKARQLACDIYYETIMKLGSFPFWMQFQEKVLFQNKYFQTYDDPDLAIKVCNHLLDWKFDKFKSLVYYDTNKNVITNEKMRYVPIFRNMSKIVIGETQSLNDLSVFNLLKQLKYLEIISCSNISSVCNLKSNLQNLHFKNCQGIIDVSPLIKNCPQITSLGINDCYCFYDISYFHQFPKLEVLSLDRCKNIKNLKLLNQCSKLIKLYLYNCGDLQENIEHIAENLYWIEILDYPADLDY